MTNLTAQQIRDAIQQGLEETWRKIDRGEIILDGRVVWPPREKIAIDEKKREASIG
jgi:hypothetical protein